jgi:hypothetical protein
MIVMRGASSRLGTGLGVVAIATILQGMLPAATASASNVCISMTGSAGQVAGVQLDLTWDSNCMDADAPKGRQGGPAVCSPEPATGKEVHTAIRGTQLRALMFSMSDSSPIPDGDLFCCAFTVINQARPRCCSLNIGNVVLSTPQGQPVSDAGVALLASLDGQPCASSSPSGSQPARGPKPPPPPQPQAPPAVSAGGVEAPAAPGGSAPQRAPAAPGGAAPQAPAAQQRGGQAPEAAAEAAAGEATPAETPVGTQAVGKPATARRAATAAVTPTPRPQATSTPVTLVTATPARSATAAAPTHTPKHKGKKAKKRT